MSKKVLVRIRSVVGNILTSKGVIDASGITLKVDSLNDLGEEFNLLKAKNCILVDKIEAVKPKKVKTVKKEKPDEVKTVKKEKLEAKETKQKNDVKEKPKRK